MQSNGQLGIRVYFDQESVGTANLLEVLRALEAAAYDSEAEELEAVGAEIGASNLVLDASRERLRQMKGRLLRVSGTEKGSVVFAAGVAAAAYFVLDKTLGESLSDAWHRTDTHRRIVGFLSERRELRASRLLEYIQYRLRKRTDQVSQEGPLEEQGVILRFRANPDDTQMELADEIER